MNKFILLFLFVLSTVSYANCIDGNQITLPKHYKTENTFSGDLQNHKSFHLIFAKDKKKKTYIVFSYLFDGTNIEELPNLSSDKPYGILSFHQSNEILTLLVTYKIKKKSFLKKIDYNILDKTKKESDALSHDDFLTSLRNKDRSILVYKKDTELKILDFKNTNNPEVSSYEFTSKKNDVSSYFKGKSVTSIRTDEYVSNGAVNDIRLYFNNNKLIFTRDAEYVYNMDIPATKRRTNSATVKIQNNRKTNTTEVLTIDITNKLLSPKIVDYKNSDAIKFKKSTSYILDNKLFQLGLSKTSGTVKISDLTTNESLNSINIDTSLSTYIIGNEEFEGIEKYLKNAGKNKFIATITANKTNQNKLRLRVDYVDYAYSYNYDWWWHHQQFMWHMQQHNMFIQQSIQNIPTNFGPNNRYNFVFENATISKNKRFFELVIDPVGKLLKDDLPDLQYKNIDKKEYIDELEDVENYSYESSCFLNTSFRYIAFDKITKSFLLKQNHCNDII